LTDHATCNKLKEAADCSCG